MVMGPEISLGTDKVTHDGIIHDGQPLRAQCLKQSARGMNSNEAGRSEEVRFVVRSVELWCRSI